jgi:hypothetical protein
MAEPTIWGTQKLQNFMRVSQKNAENRGETQIFALGKQQPVGTAFISK